MKLVLYGAEADQQELLRQLSRLPGCCYRRMQTTAYSDYDSFIAALAQSPPSCVVVAMDGAAGMEAVIAARDVLRSVPVIWFSNDSGFGVQSYRLGCAYFHQKPVSQEVLSTAIAKCV